MAEYIKREALLEHIAGLSIIITGLSRGRNQLAEFGIHYKNSILREINDFQAADVAPVRHGRWELTVHSFYRDTFDESCELCVYIVANCSECSGNHPNSYQVFSKTLYTPDDADDDFRFDQKAEEEKALLEFRNKKYEFAHYCPDCGAKMDGCADGES